MLFALAALIAAHPPTTVAREPTPLQPFVTLLSVSDYPAGAIRRGVSGTVGFMLDVGADGAPTRCTVTDPADPDLDRTTCDIFMTRAHFQPALDRNGRAVAGSVTSRVRWVMPPAVDRHPPFAPMRVANVISLNAQGNISCTMSLNGAAPEPRAEEECGFLSGSGVAQAMRAQAIPGDLILILTMVPAGAAPAPGNDEAGAELTFEDTAHLVIAPDGTLAECRPGTTRILQTPLPMRMPQACWRVGAQVVVPATGQEMRHAENTVRLYFRRRPAS